MRAQLCVVLTGATVPIAIQMPPAFRIRSIAGAPVDEPEMPCAADIARLLR